MNHIKKMPSDEKDLKKMIQELKENLIQKQNEYIAEIKKLTSKLPIFIQTVSLCNTVPLLKKEILRIQTGLQYLETTNKELENQADICAELNKELSRVNDELESENNDLLNENVILEEDLELLSEKGFESYIQKQYKLRGENDVNELLEGLWRKILSDDEQTPVDDKSVLVWRSRDNTRSAPAKNKTHGAKRIKEKVIEEKATPITFGNEIVKLPEAQLTNTGAILIF